MNRIVLVLATLFCVSACTKNQTPTQPTGITKEQQEAYVDSLGPGKKTALSKNADQITVLNVNGYYQRGLTFDRFDKSTLRLKGFGMAPSVIMQSRNGMTNLPVSEPLRMEVNKIGPGGVDRDLGRNFNKGLDIYVIAKADGSGATLLGTPTGMESILPKDYTQKSEMLWFIAVFNGGIMRFRDVGNGECLYLNSPLSEKDYRFNKNNRADTNFQMDGLVPVKASKAMIEIVFYGDADLPPGSSLTFKTHRNKFDIYTYYPLTGLSQRQQQQFQFDAPVESTSKTSLDPIDYVFSGVLLNSSSNASFTAVVKGWRLYKNY